MLTSKNYSNNRKVAETTTINCTSFIFFTVLLKYYSFYKQ